MATGFTDAEIQSAVDQFLLRELTVDTLKTGSRDTKALRDAVYDLITATLLLRPDSFFYVVWQATNKLKGLVSEQLAALDAIDADGPGITRPSKKIKGTSELTNARAALLEVNSGLTSRSAGISGSIGPAVARFRKSITRFLNDEITKNVVVSGQVTDTGEGLKQKVRSTWADAVTRHAELVDLAQNVSAALSELSGVSLPQSAVQDIVTRIQTRLTELETTLAGPLGVQESRQAMLDLLTMRTLLTKSSSFRAPILKLMPLTGDSAQLQFIDSDGEEAAVTGTVSGPFNYDPSSSLSLSINSGASTPTISLPRHSRAELRSRVFSPWVPNAGGEEAAFLVDLTTTAFVAALPVFASGVAAAAFLAPALAPSVAVTWDAGANQLVFQSSNPADISRIRGLTDTVNRTAFVSWAFNGGILEARPVPPTGAEIVAAIGAGTPLIDTSVLEDYYGTFNGVRDAAPLNVVWDRTDSGVNLVTNGTNIVTSPTKNLQRLGVKVGMGLEITAPTPGTFTITAVQGNQLTLDAVAPAGGPATYFIGHDYRGVPDGARVQMTSRAIADNTAFYRVAVGGGLIARLVLDRNIPQQDSTLIAAVFRHRLKLNARGTTTTSGVGVTSVNTLGLPVSAEVSPDLSTMELIGAGDFLFRGVRPGDRVLLTAPSLATYVQYVASVTNTRVTFTTPLPYETGAWTYEIQSYRVYQYATLVAGPTSPYVNEFLLSQYVANFAALDTLIGRLINGAKYAGQIQSGVQQYRADLQALQTALQTYSVPAERSIDNVIKTMREQGLDRATDIFLALRISEFFSMDSDGVSYSTWLAHHSSKSAREVAPVSKLAKSQLIVQEWRSLSFQVNPLDLRSQDTHNGQ